MRPARALDGVGQARGYRNLLVTSTVPRGKRISGVKDTATFFVGVATQRAFFGPNRGKNRGKTDATFFVVSASLARAFGI